MGVSSYCQVPVPAGLLADCDARGLVPSIGLSQISRDTDRNVSRWILDPQGCRRTVAMRAEAECRPLAGSQG